MTKTPVVMEPDETPGAPNGPRQGLRRVLGFWGPAALSVGVMAPTLAMSITGPGAAELVGAAAPVAFVLAAVLVLLVSSGFVALSGQFSHAGSVYGFVGGAVGPRTGFLAGWAMLGTYLVFPAVSLSGIAVFAQAALRTTGLAPGTDWFVLALAGWAVVGLLAIGGIRPTTWSLAVVEVVAVLLILALMAVVFWRLGAGTAPGGPRAAEAVLRLPEGTTAITAAAAVTGGFLAFAGFESAGSLGEEARSPRRTVPRAMLVAIGLGAVFYAACMVAQSLGFGTDSAGVAAFAGSPAPLDELAGRYVGAPMAVVLDLVAVISAVGAGLGCVVVGTRLLFALARDRVLPGRLASVAASGTPLAPVAVELAMSLALLVGFRLAGASPSRTFFTLATLGVLSLLVMYVVTDLAAARLRWRAGRRASVAWPVLGALAAGTVLGLQVASVASSGDAGPLVVVGWLVVGVLVLLLPGQVDRIARGLARSRDASGGPPAAPA
ncbi:APC family permease [Actinomycetospora lemnae]|uniref:APC family permease n=1 Tax=Actinomycetospora lemnae TaxID=3019891 RepID=A0ABT5SY88_9PSEU|nr:APC family permease [Actinomycetospora sp. DW7H6]MDD7967823.1 APC family permease [Actinomycetospora sp. DW7H6]